MIFDFIHTDSCTKHLDNNNHKRKAAIVDDESHEAKKQKLQVRISGDFAKQTAQQQHQQLELKCLVEVLSSTKVPLHVPNNANLKAYLKANLN